MRRPLRLTKHHALGNDFLVLLDQAGDGELARRLCDRRRGVGADGLLVGTAGGHDGVDLSMVVHNADGSRAETSGNGIRCLAQAEGQRRHPDPLDSGNEAFELMIGTDTGPRRVSVGAGADARTITARVDMGKALPGPEPDHPVRSGDERELVTIRRQLTVNMGNPHVVYLVDDARSVPLDLDGRIREQTYSGGINVEFISLTPGQADALDLRVWERGAGITEACGSGACAAVHAAHGWGLVGEQARVHMSGGDVDVVLGDTVTLVGPATYVAAVEVEGAA